jgi:hypothetical protein
MSLPVLVLSAAFFVLFWEGEKVVRKLVSLWRSA